MPILVLFCLLPFLLGLGLQYIACRFFKRRAFRILPLLLALGITALVGSVRYFGWSMEHGGGGAPLETLLFMPGLPAALVLGGIFTGWRIWKHRWSPRIIKGK
ncbi:MAG: Tat pathway signal protein [Pseudoflavonifractor sp.]